MEIDEDRERVDFSDHCMVSIYLGMQKEDRRLGGGIRERECYKLTEERKQKYRMQVERELEAVEEVTVEVINEIIRKAAEDHLKTVHREKIRYNGEREQPWINDEIRKAIKVRRKPK